MLAQIAKFRSKRKINRITGSALILCKIARPFNFIILKHKFVRDVNIVLFYYDFVYFHIYIIRGAHGMNEAPDRR